MRKPQLFIGLTSIISLLYLGYLLWPTDLTEKTPISSLDVSTAFEKPLQSSFLSSQYSLIYSGEGLGNEKVLLSGTLEEVMLSQTQSFLRCLDCRFSGVQDVKMSQRIRESMSTGTIVDWAFPKRYQSHRGDDFWYHLLLRIQFSSFSSTEQVSEISPWGPITVKYLATATKINKFLISNEFNGEIKYSYELHNLTSPPYIKDLVQQDEIKLPFLDPSTTPAVSLLKMHLLETRYLDIKSLFASIQAAKSKAVFNFANMEKDYDSELAQNSLDGWTYNDIVQAALAGDRRKSFIKLRSWIKVTDDFDLLREDYFDSSIDDDIFKIWTRALLSVGNDEAQKILTERLNMSLDNPKEARFLISGMAMLDHANAETIINLKKIASSHSQFHKTSVLSLGAIANQLSNQDPQMRSELMSDLENMLRSDDEKEILLALSSLGNAGSLSFEVLQPYLNHENVQIRTVAIKSLRFSESIDAYTFLVRGFANFSSLEKKNAVVALNYWSLSKDNLLLLSRFFKLSQSEHLKIKVLSVLSRYRRGKVNVLYKDVLLQMLDAGQSVRVEKLLAQMIST